MRLLNRYYTAYDLLLVVGDLVLVVAASSAVRSLLTSGDLPTDDLWLTPAAQGFAMALIVATAF